MIKPLYDRVLMEEIQAESTTASGILLPESKEKPSLARVVAVGPGRVDANGVLESMPVKVGDTVIYKKYSTTDIKYDGNNYLIIEMKDILAVIEEEA